MSNTKFKELKPGEVLSEQQFYKVVKKTADKVQLQVDGKTGTDSMIVVDKGYAEKHLTSAVQSVKEVKIGKTEAADMFRGLSGVAITVNFNKQVKEADVVEEIMRTYEGSTPKEFATAVKKAVKKGLDGEERTMVGRHYGEQNELGRIPFIDMEAEKLPGKEYDSRIRQVDPRSINWFICRGTKYIVK